MSCCTSPTIDAWSCHIIHHLLSMHGHVIWYITYYRCMVMSYDRYIIYYRCMVMSYCTSPTIDTWTYHMLHHLSIYAWSCHMIHHLLSMHGHVLWYITYYRCMVMSYDTSPTIDAWSCHIIHHPLPMHGHVMLYITYYRCMVMSYDTSPTFDAWSCHVTHQLP